MLLGVTVSYSMLARAIIFTCDGLHSPAGCGVGGGGCGGGNQITQQIESHHLSIRPSVSSSVRSAKFALHLALFANGHGMAPTAAVTAAVSSVSKPGCFFRSVALARHEVLRLQPAMRAAECPSSVHPPAIFIAVSQSARCLSARKKAHQSKARPFSRRPSRRTASGRIDRVLAD